jgi:hypothetical protein
MTEDDPAIVLQTATDFALAFGLGSELVVEGYIEYLLSPPRDDKEEAVDESAGKDIRTKLSSLEGVVKTLIRRLDSPVNRAKVLRNCLVRLESSNNAHDYERLSVALVLYQTELSSLLARNEERASVDPKPFLVDLELVDRRRDALAILSSYFQGDKKRERPPVSSFFLPLPDSWDGGSNKPPTKSSRGVLGKESKTSCDIFDPLDPFEKFLNASCSSAVTSALASLCLPLGVPRGYIHARSLIARFRKSKSDGAALPSFEVDVLPVLNRLKSSGDVADLAEWCSLEYNFEDEDKLKCLDHSLNFAMKASNEAERYSSRNSSNDAIGSQDKESKALERVKQITTAKDLLADRLAINTILSSVGITSEKNCVLSKVVDDLMKRLEEEVWSKPEFIPERFVEIFLSESSFLAAEASLCNQKALSMGQFRQLSILVHRACKSVADKYSHVQVGHIARRLTRRWLFHGDQPSSEEDEIGVPGALVDIETSRAAVASLLPEIDEDDTVNFVMDLTSLKEEDTSWSTDIGSGPSSKKDVKLTSEEEPSSLKVTGSAREASELSSRRASLRISFAMAFADGYHSTGTCDTNQDENIKPTSNRASKRKNKGLLAKMSSSETKQQHESVLDHSRELLRIVFAKSGSADWIEKDLNTSIDSRSVSGTARSTSRKTITFAMRHRALRASSILCPQDALEQVLREEESMINSASSLKKCSFGAFLAKEIEEMRLPLPHSDLAQLSTMHFPSYARALWRHHRDSKGCKGRLLLLILEMYLKEPVSDYDFFLSIVTEMENLNLPRTLLLSFECIADHMDKIGPDAMASFAGRVGSEVTSAVGGLSKIVFAEFGKMGDATSVSMQDIAGGFETLQRLATVIQSFSHSLGGQMNLVAFIEALLELVSAFPSHQYTDRVSTILGNALRRVTDKETSTRLAERISSLFSQAEKIFRVVYSSYVDSDMKCSDDRMTGCLGHLEGSLDNLSAK